MASAFDMVKFGKLLHAIEGPPIVGPKEKGRLLKLVKWDNSYPEIPTQVWIGPLLPCSQSLAFEG